MIITKLAGLGAERTTRREPDELIVEEPMSSTSSTLRPAAERLRRPLGWATCHRVVGGAAASNWMTCGHVSPRFR